VSVETGFRKMFRVIELIVMEKSRVYVDSVS
jgi:hypothetical protein